MNDQAHRLRELAQDNPSGYATGINSVLPYGHSEKISKSIAITSGKGGVGKSNIALFLATTFAVAQKKVLLLDADFGLANVHILLGMAPLHTITHFIDGRCSMADIITETVEGFDIIPGASGIEGIAHLDPVLSTRFRQGFNQLERTYDVLIIDTGAGIGSTVTQFASNANLTLIVMTPEPTSLADAYTMVKVLHEKQTPQIGVIVNMSSSDKEGIETFDRLNTLVVKFLKRPLEHFGTIPFNNEVGKYVKKQKCLLNQKSDSAFTRRIHTIARRTYSINFPNRTGFFNRLLSKNEL